MSSDKSSTTKMEPATVPNRIQRGSPSDNPPLRLSMSATVVKGFGRGSKLLGIPTANMDMKEIGQKVNDTPTGIYFGYTMLKGTVYKAVVSIGWNPYFDNSEKTVEPHLLHKFEEDFYGEKLHLLLCGFIRNELNFKSLDDLIAAIGDDILYARRKFEEAEVAALSADDPFWAEVATERSTPEDHGKRSSSGNSNNNNKSSSSIPNGTTMETAGSGDVTSSAADNDNDHKNSNIGSDNTSSSNIGGSNAGDPNSGSDNTGSSNDQAG